MSRRIIGVLLTVVCCFFFSGGLNAQEMMRVNMTAPKFPLLLSKNVQQELKISADQMKKIQEKIGGGGGQGPIINLGSEKGAPTQQYKVVVAPGGGAGKASEGAIQAFPGMPDFKKLDDELDKLLEPAQRDRLKQLWLQQQGLMALGQDKVAEEVGLEAEQKTLVKEAIDHHNTSMRDFFMDQNNRTDQNRMRDFFKTQRERTENDISLLLSEKQKETWQQMLGPKFDFKAK